MSEQDRDLELQRLREQVAALQQFRQAQEQGSQSGQFIERKQAEESRRQIEQALRDSEALYHSLVETVPLNLFRKDLQGRFTFGNRLFCATLGCSLEDLQGKTDYDFYPLELADKYRHDDQIVAQTGQLFETIEEHLRSSGEIIYVQVLKTPVYDARSQVVGIQGIFWDVTVQTQAAEAQKKAMEAAEAANRAKSEFLANMSHEIRTPMNAIVGMTELVLRTNLTNEQREYLEMVRQSADSLMKVINDILDFSKIEAGKLDLDRVAFDLRDHLGDTLKSLAVQAHAKGLELACRVALDVPHVIVADPHRLRQVLVNLIGNAIKFTEKGEVVVEVEIRARRAHEMALHFAVCDTGIGIPSDHLSMIFESFSQVDGSMTRKYSGTGLGLAISRRLVEMLGGCLTVQSTLGQGSRFFFTAWFEVTEERPAEPVDPERVRGLSVLVVDDNATNRRILAETLAHWEMRPTTVAGGEEAIVALRQAHEAGQPFALVVLDANMPGMDGFSLASSIKMQPELAGPTVMMISSSGQSGSLARRCEAGISCYLTKPVKQADLWKAILIALGKNGDDQSGGSSLSVREAPARRLPAPPRPLRILLAEDNLFNQRLAISLLQKEGHTVVLARNGIEAVAIIERETLDLVLMDVQMPEMDGFEATAVIRQKEAAVGGHLPILAMTAHAMKGDRERCLEAGMDDYVSKPIRAQDLFEAVARVTQALPSRSGEATSVSATDELDWQEALAHVAGDRLLLRDLVRLFLQECSGWMSQVRRGILAGNVVETHRAAHNLKSCLGNFAAKTAYESARSVEDRARKKDLQGAEPAYRALEEALERLRPVLMAFLTDQGSGVRDQGSAPEG